MKFFHNTVIQNRQRSKIHKLRKKNGWCVDTRAEKEEELVKHFKNVMTEDQLNKKHDINKITRLAPMVVTQEHNEILIKPIELQDVEEAMHQMKLGKCPWLYGFTSNFFHYCWDLIKQEV